MSQIVVKTDNPDRFNVCVTLPSVGNKTPNHEGEFEHDNEDEVLTLVKYQPDFYIKGEEDLNKKSETDEFNSEAGDGELNNVEEDDLNKGSENDVEDELTAEEVDLTPEEKSLIIASLPDKKLKELQELCKPFPGSEWRNKNKEFLTKYLTEKLS